MIPRPPSHPPTGVSSESLRPILDLIECVVCLDYFSPEGSKRAPRLLDCSHSLCLSCCRDLASSKLGTNSSQKSISCPVCRKVTFLSKGGTGSLRPNLTAIGLLDVPLLRDMRQPQPEKMSRPQPEKMSRLQPEKMSRSQPGTNLKRSLDTNEHVPVMTEAKIQRVGCNSSYEGPTGSQPTESRFLEVYRNNSCYGMSEATFSVGIVAHTPKHPPRYSLLGVVFRMRTIKVRNILLKELRP